MKGFSLIRSKCIPKLNITLHHLINHTTGTEYLHIHAPEDSNNVFAIAFPTPVSNSKGTPHILEHTTLCGSRNFPIRDPFFKMLNRSLSTYMNAWTGSDFTMYPFSTQNPKDFENLRAVYLDAVFQPLLSKWDFLQEGWRIEHEQQVNESQKQDGKWTFKGIVFNEMKGVFSSKEALYSHCISNALMQNSCYSFESGGLPLEIVDLSHEELVEFHREAYKLEKCKIFTFGNIPLEEHVAFLDKYISELVANKKESEGDKDCKKIMRESNTISTQSIDDHQRIEFKKTDYISSGSVFKESIDQNESLSNCSVSKESIDQNESLSKCSVDQKINLIPSFEGPIRKKVHCQFHDSLPPEKQSIFSVSFLANSTQSSTQETFNLQIICHLLFDGPSSPFHKALIDANIGNDYSPSTGYDSSTAIASISIGLEGIDSKSADHVEKIIFDTLEGVKKEGFSKDRVESVIHQLSIGQKYRSAKFGLSLASSLLPSWTVAQKQIDPFEEVDLQAKIDAFTQAFDNQPGFVADLIDKYFLRNNRRLHLLMEPSPTFNQEQSELETQKLNQKLTSYSKAFLEDQAKELESRQNAPQPTELLPCLRIEEIEPLHRGIAWEKRDQITFRKTEDANELSFFKSYTPIRSWKHILRYPMLSQFKNNLGITSLSIHDWTERVKSSVGSLDFDFSLVSQPQASFKLFANLSSHCLDSKVEKMFSLMRQMERETNFQDHSRMETLLNSQFSAFQNSISQSGHQFALSYAASSLCEQSFLADSLSGLRQLFYLRELNERIRTGEVTIPQISKEFESLWHELEEEMLHSHLESHNFFITNSQNVNEKLFYANEFLDKSGTRQLNETSSNEDSNCEFPSLLQSTDSCIHFPFNTFYLGAAAKTVAFPHQDSFPLLVLAKCLRSQFLHGEIREKGGAYGAGCSYSAKSGIFSFHSYRDPTPLKSISAIEACSDWLSRAASLTEQHLLEAKLSVFSELDSPVSVDAKGISQRLCGLSDEQMQQLRDGILAVSLEQVRSCAKYLDVKKRFAVLGPVGEREIEALAKVTQSEWNLLPMKVQ